jgi:membrane-bound metal-dependent hydrolase YbcI (DUF457 family)
MGCVIALAQAAFSKGPLLKRALLYAAVIATHPLVDFFTVVPPYLGAMPLFWPFSETCFASPVALLPTAMTYVGPVPIRESLLKTFAGEALLAAPLLAWEAAAAFRRRSLGRAAVVVEGPETLTSA